MRFLILISVFLFSTQLVSSQKSNEKNSRSGKSFFHFGGHQNPMAAYLNGDLSRSLPSRGYDSPIYYVRLPPIPYSYVPGFGYISQPPTTNTLVNLPINFLANGKPSAIYQWNGAFDPLSSESLPPAPPPKPEPEPDSSVHRLPGKFPFNGKVTDLYLLKDPADDDYSSFYEDTLNTIYP